MKIKNCPNGTKARVWCIGTHCWDDTKVEIISKLGSLVKVKDIDGVIMHYDDSCDVIVESFPRVAAEYE